MNKLFSRRIAGRLIGILLIFVLFLAPMAPVVADPSERGRISFHKTVEASLLKSAAALDKAAVQLFNKLDKTDNISVKILSHFYDSRIRRYFISISGKANFTGKFPYQIKGDEFVLTSNGEVSFDINLSQVKQSRNAITCNFNGAITVSMDRLAYKLIKTVPHLAASGALSPAFNMLSEFLEKLNIGVLSEAISETLRSFSTVALAKAATELISSAGKNREVSRLIKDTIKDGSIMSYLTLLILKCSTVSLVSISGASLGGIIGSTLAPGPGGVVGAFLGSQIMTIVAKAVIYQLSAEMPMKQNIKRMVLSHRILQQNPADESARAKYEKSLSKLEKSIKVEFDSEHFKLFESLLKEIDQLNADERLAMVPLLKNLQSALGFKITNDGDWYFARKFYLLKQYVDRWQMGKLIVFTIE